MELAYGYFVRLYVRFLFVGGTTPCAFDVNYADVAR